ncbi:MAG: CoB--CoM heterodisulfide reductase iron-sulfur subunit B family protein [Rhodocyclaceae bacterium]
MTKKQYAFYPGCSSQKGASAANYITSFGVICDKLDIQLNEIPDWNCCAASIGYAEGGELPRIVMGARNLALSDQHLPGQDIVSGCPACWLANREATERLQHSTSLMAEANEALKEVSLNLRTDFNTKSRHFTEVLIEDIGYAGMKAPVIKPLDGVKIAGYVGCQANRPYGIAGESFENPQYLDKMIETCGAEAVPYDQKVTCCGGALAFSEPEKAQALIQDIVGSAYDHGADLIVTPCPLCQANVEIYQSEINKKKGTKFNMPVVYYTQLLNVAYGGSIKESGLDGQLIRADKLEKIAGK